MNIITGEKFQDICDVGISKLEHKRFESKASINSINIDKFNFTNYDNPYLVYCNSSLINKHKKQLVKSNLFRKLEAFKNPFELILHNSDQSFDESHLHYFDIPNLKKIYTQNINVLDKRVIPIPIGIANSCWDWGNLKIFNKVLSMKIEKSNDIYFHFKINCGVREESRPKCFEILTKKGLKFLPSMNYEDYLKTLSSYKYCISPKGNGIDCHRMWEALYLKVIPICERSILTEYFATLFPIVIVDNWEEVDLEKLEKSYDKWIDWSNYLLLDFIKYTNYIKLQW